MEWGTTKSSIGWKQDQVCDREQDQVWDREQQDPLCCKGMDDSETCSFLKSDITATSHEVMHQLKQDT